MPDLAALQTELEAAEAAVAEERSLHRRLQSLREQRLTPSPTCTGR